MTESGTTHDFLDEPANDFDWGRDSRSERRWRSALSLRESAPAIAIGSGIALIAVGLLYLVG